jgi:rhodanese-related sulfurtransferase
LNNDSASNEPKIINKEKFDQLVKDSNTRIMDVRTPGEVSEGYIAGAIIFNDINDSNFDANLDKLDKSKNYIVYCKSGGRSSRAVEIMREKGFKKVYDLEGGVSNWTGELKH